MYIDWATKIIHVLKTDSFMSLVQSTPTVIYDCALNDFRLGLKDIEDSSDGMAFLRTHKHNTEVALGGLTFARVIEIINDYTITFEDGQYAVNLVGANTNIADKVNVNQVSIRPQNSAGLISSPDIEYASFQSGVWIDTVTGDDLNKGNEQLPVKTIERALIVASYRGFKKLYAQSNITIGTGHNFDDFIIQGQSHVVTKLTIESGASCERLTIDNCHVEGVLDGDSEIRNCVIGDVVYFNGHIHSCGLYGMFYLDGAANAVIVNCSTINADDPPIIDMGGSGQSLAMPNYSGLITIQNLDSATEEVGIGLNAGMVTIDSTVVDGNLIIAGTGILNHTQTASENVNSEGLMSKNTIGIAVWDEPIGDHLIAGTTGFSTGINQFNGSITVDVVNGVSGTAFPIGTERVPVDNLTDAVTIAESRGIADIRFESDYTFPNGTYITNYNLFGKGRQKTIFTFEAGCILAYCVVHEATLTGWETGIIGFNNCTLEDFGSVGLAPSSVELIARECIFRGTVSLPSNYSGVMTALDCWALTDSNGDPPIFDMGGCTAKLQARNWSGVVVIKNNTAENSIRIFLTSGGVILDSTITAGDFLISGVGVLEDNSTSVTSLDVEGLMSADAVLGGAIEGPLSLTETLRLILAATTGSSAGAGTGVFEYKSVDGVTTRISSTFDANGNRQITLLDAS